METKKFIVIVSILSFGIWLSLWFILQKPDQPMPPIEHVHTEEDEPLQFQLQQQPQQEQQPKKPIAFHPPSSLNYTLLFADFLQDGNLWVPDDWTGLPLSKTNPLYVDYKKSQDNLDKFYQFLNILEGFNTLQWNGDDDWADLIHEYSPFIGWNGVFDAVELAEDNIGSEFAKRLHSLGELLATENVRGRYMVEITSRDMLHKAPMHGAVWTIINNTGTDDLDALFEVVDEELCFFKSYPTMGNIWISCAHGVGHGLAQVYGKAGIPDALEVCDAHPDQQFKYACATGIYMSLGNEFAVSTFQPCDTNKFAPACFRFKNKMAMVLFSNVSDPCVTQRTPYHRRACIWGFNYISTNRNPLSGFELCEVYRPEDPNEQPAANDYAACLDGFWGSHELSRVPDRLKPPSFCEPLSRYTTAYAICEYYQAQTLRTFSFEGEEEVFYYNFNLLEELFRPEDLNVAPAELLPEWKNNRLDLTAQMQLMLGGAGKTNDNDAHKGGHEH